MALLVLVGVLLIFILPSFLRRRSIVAQTRIEERYSQDLRLLTIEQQAYLHQPAETSDRGTIYSRKPEVPMSEANLSVKGLAAERARRKARIAQRAANRQRTFAASLTVAALAGVAWLCVAFTSLPIFAAILATVVAGGTLFTASYLVNAMNTADEKDREALENITRKLESRSRTKLTPAERTLERMRKARRSTAHDVEHNSNKSSEESVLAEEAKQEVRRSSSVSESAVSAKDNRPIQLHLDSDILRDEAALYIPRQEKKPETQPVVQMPSYTIKPMIRRVTTAAPTLASDELGSASVPYRPVHLGERFADAPLAEPAVSNNEEKGLSGGSALDELLLKRRGA